jgi:thioredoxin-dependent peroxiredoxin
MPNRLKPGEKAPDFTIPDQDGNVRISEELRGVWSILYFYPKDNTSACTVEALAFSAVYEKLTELKVSIMGISPDSVESHKKFIQKNELNLTLLSDPSHTVIEAYGVWTLKKMYGREYMGVERSTFLIRPDGIIADIWHKVKVKGHVEEVTSQLQELLAEEST